MPWRIAIEDTADDGGHVAYCAPENAPLIAAAPKMLTALDLVAVKAETALLHQTGLSKEGLVEYLREILTESMLVISEATGGAE